MPTYDYHCKNCAQKLEIKQKITDPALTICPNCSSHSFHRGPGGGIGFMLTGSGFYKTDYCSSTKGETKSVESANTTCCPCGKNQTCDN